jgi:hypothetical protein
MRAESQKAATDNQKIDEVMGCAAPVPVAVADTVAGAASAPVAVPVRARVPLGSELSTIDYQLSTRAASADGDSEMGEET